MKKLFHILPALIPALLVFLLIILDPFPSIDSMLCDLVYSQMNGCGDDIKLICIDEERRIMESHVVMTERILSKVHFNSSFVMAPVWAAQHHECINGKGFCNHGRHGEKWGYR